MNVLDLDHEARVELYAERVERGLSALTGEPPAPPVPIEGLNPAPPSAAETPITHDGVTRTMQEWADHLHLTIDGFRCRIARYGTEHPRTWRPRIKRKAWGPSARTRYLTWEGVRRTLREWADHLGITPQTLHGRLKRWGEDDPRAFAPRGGA